VGNRVAVWGGVGWWEKWGLGVVGVVRVGVQCVDLLWVG
jgi:hypothetical protein